MGGENVARGAVFPRRADDRNVFLAGRDDPAVLRIDFIVLLQHAAADHLIDVLIRQVTLPFRLGLVPHVDQVLLQAAERLLFGDARVGHAVVMVVKESLLFLGRKVTVARHPVIVRMGDEVHDVLLQVVRGAADEGNLVLTDHFRKGKPELGGRHRAGHGEEHLASLCQKVFIRFGSIHEGRGIEVAVVVRNEL